MAGVQMRGGTDELRALKKRMDTFRSPQYRRFLLKQLSQEGLHQVAECFDKERDPYGAKWAPIQHPSAKRRGGKVLSDTGRLRNSFRASSNSATFIISSRVKYAAIHNYGGTTHAAARTEMRRYAVLRGDKRRRIKLYSKRAKSVRTIASYGESSATIPARPFLPETGRLGARWTAAFTAITAKTLASFLRRKGGGH